MSGSMKTQVIMILIYYLLCFNFNFCFLQDGIQDSGEAPLSGVVVRLLTSAGAATGLQNRTDVNGRFILIGNELIVFFIFFLKK